MAAQTVEELRDALVTAMMAGEDLSALPEEAQKKMLERMEGMAKAIDDFVKSHSGTVEIANVSYDIKLK